MGFYNRLFIVRGGCTGDGIGTGDLGDHMFRFGSGQDQIDTDRDSDHIPIVSIPIPHPKHTTKHNNKKGYHCLIELDTGFRREKETERGLGVCWKCFGGVLTYINSSGRPRVSTMNQWSQL